MSQLPRTLYAKFLKTDLQQNKHTVSDTGLVKKYFFSDPHDVRLLRSLTNTEVIACVPIEAFADKVVFKPVENGVWENCSTILMDPVRSLE